MRRLAWLLLALAALPSHAQNPVEVDPEHYRLEYEDKQVRVLRFRLAPGERSPLHEHAARITVVVSGSRLRIADTEGAIHEMTIYSGHAEREPATRHIVENVGNTVYEELTTEFKDAASQPPKLVVKAPPPPPPAPRKEEPRKAEAKKIEEKPAVTASVPAAAQPAAKPVPSGTAPTPAPTAKPQPEVAAAVPPPAPPEPQPIIKPLKVRPPEEPSRRRRKSFAADEMSEATVNNTRLAFMEQGKGQTVVFVHGAMGDYRTWQLQIPEFAKRFRVVSYSRRYHYPNPSTGKEEDYTYEANLRDLAEFLKALNAGPVHLVGHGYGAAVATLLAERHPEMVRSLVVSEPGFDKLLDEKRAYRSHWARDEIYNIIRKPLSRPNPENGVRVYHNWLAETQPWPQIDPQEQYERMQNANALRAQTVDPTAPAFTCAAAKKIKTPTLVVAGQNRSPNSAEITGTLSACLANSERVTISEAGPAAYLDNAKEYNDAVLGFLAKQ